MSYLIEPAVDIAIEEIRQRPELLANLLLAGDDRSIMMERRANVVRIMYLKNYEPATQRLVAEARAEYQVKKEGGYSREQAFADLWAAETEIAEQLSGCNEA